MDHLQSIQWSKTEAVYEKSIFMICAFKPPSMPTEFFQNYLFLAPTSVPCLPTQPQAPLWEVFLHKWRRQLLQVGEAQHILRMSEDEDKVKLCLSEPAIQKLTKMIIPTDLEMLQKCQINTEKY